MSVAQRQQGLPDEIELDENDPRIQEHLNPPKSYAERRREEYLSRGLTAEILSVGLVEYIAGHPEEMQRIAAIRDEVKALIPKE